MITAPFSLFSYPFIIYIICYPSTRPPIYLSPIICLHTHTFVCSLQVSFSPSLLPFSTTLFLPSPDNFGHPLRASPWSGLSVAFVDRELPKDQ